MLASHGISVRAISVAGRNPEVDTPEDPAGLKDGRIAGSIQGLCVEAPAAEERRLGSSDTGGGATWPQGAESARPLLFNHRVFFH